MPGGQGFRLLELGAIGPIAFNISWYANFPFFLCLWRMLKGATPGLRLSVISALWAASVFLPYFVFDFEQTGRFQANAVRGPAVFLWFSAFVANVAVSFAAALQEAP